jgi:hypothetical protein
MATSFILRHPVFEAMSNLKRYNALTGRGISQGISTTGRGGQTSQTY